MSYSLHFVPRLGPLRVLLVAGLVFVLGVGAAVAGSGYADRFSSNGDLIAGWYWLRDRGLEQYAEYTWTQVPRTGDLMLEFNVLATDEVNGGPGANAHFDLLVGYPGSGQFGGGVFKKFGLTLQNVGDEGPGYTNHGFYTLRREALEGVMPANGSLFIRVQRGGERSPHVAFNTQSIRVVAKQDLQDDMLGDLLGGLLGDLQGDGSLTELELDDLRDLLGGLLGGGRMTDDELRDLLGDLLSDGRSTDLDRLRDLLEDLSKGDDRIVIDGYRGGTLTDQQLRDLLEQLLGDGTIVSDGRTGDDTGPDEMNLELGDHGDEGQCFLDRPCIGDAASGFRSTGFAGTEGWFWLRAPTVGQYADWVFEQPPAGALVLDISGLAQNIPGHVQTDAAHVLVTLGYPGSGSLGGQIGPFAVALPMIWDDSETDIWKTRALVAIPSELASSVIPVTGGLYVHVERVDEHEPDVGFSAGSVLLYPAQSIGR